MFQKLTVTLLTSFFCLFKKKTINLEGLLNLTSVWKDMFSGNHLKQLHASIYSFILCVYSIPFSYAG